MEYNLKKTKTPQPKTPNVKQDRDSFFTPSYATRLILPYIPNNVKGIWDVGAGRHFIGNVLGENGYRILSTDIDGLEINLPHNFLEEDYKQLVKSKNIDMLVSNIPFSLKKEFIYKAVEIGLPFCFLMPFDMSGYLWDVFKNHGLQAIVPERRIDFITPNTVSRVNDYIGLSFVNKEFGTKYTISKLDKFLKEASSEELSTYKNNRGRYIFVEQISNELLSKVSSSDFHSFWLAGNMELEKDFTFVELSRQDKGNIL